MSFYFNIPRPWPDYTSPTRITIVATAVEPHTHSFTVDIGAVFKFPNHDHCLAILQEVHHNPHLVLLQYNCQPIAHTGITPQHRFQIACRTQLNPLIN